MKSAKKIALIVCYYGKVPWYTPLFLKGCRFNNTIDFLIITDLDFGEVPQNVKVVSYTLAELQCHASAMLEIPVNLTDPYKLCDLKPAYGVLFQDLLIMYDFWGYIDIDVILGDIRKFMTDELLQAHDILSVRADYLTGYFCLYRNLPLINSLFKRSKDYTRVFSGNEHYCFDECNFLFLELMEGKNLLEIDADVESMSHVALKAAKSNEISLYMDCHVLEGTPGELSWINGTLIYREYEVLLYHLISYKKQIHHYSKRKQYPDKLYIGAFYMSAVPLNAIAGSLLETYYALRRGLDRLIENLTFKILVLRQARNSHVGEWPFTGIYCHEAWNVGVYAEGEDPVVDLNMDVRTKNVNLRNSIDESASRLYPVRVGKNKLVCVKSRTLFSFSFDKENAVDDLEIYAVNNWRKNFKRLSPVKLCKK